MTWDRNWQQSKYKIDLTRLFLLFQVAAIQAEVTKQQQETEKDLAKAEPALQAANAALNTLNRVNHSCTHKYRNQNPVTTIHSIYFICTHL